MRFEAIIRKHVLKNAFDYGKANPGAVVGKVIGEFPEAKKDMKKTMELIKNITEEVNKLDKQTIEKEVNKYNFEKKEEKPKKLVEATGKVITRFPPEPSGYPHIGHAKAAWLDYMVAKENEGGMILRFDDTNPEKENEGYVKAIKEGLEWLGIKWDKESYTSDNIEKIYKFAEKLIEDGQAYVATSTQEEISKMRISKKPVDDRQNSPQKNLELWKEMKNGKKYVLLYKGNLESQNTVMRDPALARVILANHYRQKTKYKVWPGYDLAVVSMDNIEGITHSMRSKEYELRDELYLKLCDDLGIKKPDLIGFSRLDIKNTPISKRLLRPLVEEKKVIDWDDPRLPTLFGLKRRGILPEAIKEFVLSFGLSKVESNPDYEKLLVINRKIVDPKAKHFFFVPDPVKVSTDISGKTKYYIKGEEKTVEIENAIFIPKKDFDQLEKSEILALKDLAFVKWDGKLTEIKQKEIPNKKIQWVSAKDNLECEILIPKDLLTENGVYNEKSLEIVKGYCERACDLINEGEIIQFERFGFCRLDKKERNKLTFIFTC